MRISGQSILATVFPAAHGERQGPGHVPGPQPDRARHAFGYSVPNLLIDHAMRNPHVPPGFWRGVNVNQNAIYIECFMDELAHAIGAGRAGVPAQADDQAPEAPRGAQRGGREDRLGQAGAARPSIRGLVADDGASAATWRARAEISVGRRQDQDPPHRRRDRPGLRRQSGADRPAGRRLVRLRAFGAVLRRDARSRTARSSRPTSTPTTRCASRRCRRWSRSSCRPATTPWGGVGEPTICVAAPAVLNAYLQGDRQAHPLVPAEEPQPADRLIARSGGSKAAALIRERDN